MGLKQSVSERTKYSQKEDNKKTEIEIFSNIKDGFKDTVVLSKIYPQGEQEETITGIYEHYYKNNYILSLFTGIYYALEGGERAKAISILEEEINGTSGHKTYSPKDLLTICIRDAILPQDKIKIFQKHLAEVSTLYDELIALKNISTKKMFNLLKGRKGNLQDEIEAADDFGLAINLACFKIILYFEKMEFGTSTQIK